MGGVNCITHAVFQTADSDPIAERPARFGIIISRAVGNAVTRNLVRRRLKSVIERRLEQGFSNFDVVLRVLPHAAEANFEQLCREVNRALDRVERLREREVI